MAIDTNEPGTRVPGMTGDDIIRRVLAGDPTIIADVEREFEARPAEDAAAALECLSLGMRRVDDVRRQAVAALARAASRKPAPARDPDPEIDAIVVDVARMLAALASSEEPDDPEFLRLIELTASTISGYPPERVLELACRLADSGDRDATIRDRMVFFNRVLTRDKRAQDAFRRLHEHKLRLEADAEGKPRP